MTYTFKLARRLAISRNIAMLAALLAACSGDATAPDAASTGSFDTPVALQVSPRLVTIETGQQVQFRGHTQAGDQTRRPPKRGRQGITVTWQATGGTIESDGMFSSATAGTFKVIGRGRGKHQTDTSVVIVIPPPTDLVRIAVTPDPVTLDAGASRTFTATGYLADGSTSAVGVNWSANGGEVDPAGAYLAGSTSGSYRVVATNTAGTLADTANVTINSPAPAAPTLTSVIVSPASASLVLGGSKQFHAYGRTSAGDSVAVVVAFSASGGSITTAGLYAGGTTAGSYRVIASSSGLADTSVVTLTQALGSSGAGGMGIPFGASQLLASGAGMDPFTMSLDSYSAGMILTQISEARTGHYRLLMNMTGGAHSNYLTDGVFDITKWQAKMDSYNTAAIKSAVAAAVTDGIIVGNSVMDEPHVSGGGDGNTWGPAGTMTKARVDQLCSYVKAMFPTLPVGVVHRHDVFEPNNSYRVCEFIVDQYSTRAGDVVAFRDAALAMGRRDGHAILFAMNILNGGVQDKDGTWDCMSSGQAGVGTYSPNCRMTAQQVHDYGLVLGPAGCGLNMWRFDATYFAKAANQQAFKDVAARLATLPANPCRRQ